MVSHPDGRVSLAETGGMRLPEHGTLQGLLRTGMLGESNHARRLPSPVSSVDTACPFLSLQPLFIFSVSRTRENNDAS